MTFRIDEVVVRQLRTFVRDNAGKPLYLEIGAFVEAAILREIARVEQQAAAGDGDAADLLTPPLRRVLPSDNGLSRHR